MKYFMLLVLAVSLSACGNHATTDTTPDTPRVIDASNAGSKKVDPKQVGRLGDTCGPARDTLCGEGLTCQFEGNNQSAGKCLTAIVKPDLECETNQDPVCGLIGNNKNGFLNSCFAEKFGAEVLYKGFCIADESVIGNCEAKAYSRGNCQESFTGAVFNTESKNCEAVTMAGCGADIPFSSLESCKAACS